MSEQSDRDHETYAVIGAAMEVHRQLGHGFLERVYNSALQVELGLRGIPHTVEVEFPVRYKSLPLPLTYRADLVCFGTLIVELKAQHLLPEVQLAQLINYLKASGLQQGLLLNFGGASLEFRRVVRTLGASSAQSA